MLVRDNVKQTAFLTASTTRTTSAAAAAAGAKDIAVNRSTLAVEEGVSFIIFIQISNTLQNLN